MNGGERTVDRLGDCERLLVGVKLGTGHTGDQSAALGGGKRAGEEIGQGGEGMGMRQGTGVDRIESLSDQGPGRQPAQGPGPSTRRRPADSGTRIDDAAQVNHVKRPDRVMKRAGQQPGQPGSAADAPNTSEAAMELGGCPRARACPLICPPGEPGPSSLEAHGQTGPKV